MAIMGYYPFGGPGNAIGGAGGAGGSGGTTVGGNGADGIAYNFGNGLAFGSNTTMAGATTNGFSVVVFGTLLIGNGANGTADSPDGKPGGVLFGNGGNGYVSTTAGVGDRARRRGWRRHWSRRCGLGRRRYGRGCRGRRDGRARRIHRCGNGLRRRRQRHRRRRGIHGDRTAPARRHRQHLAAHPQERLVRFGLLLDERRMGLAHGLDQAQRHGRPVADRARRRLTARGDDLRRGDDDLALRDHQRRRIRRRRLHRLQSSMVWFRHWGAPVLGCRLSWFVGDRHHVGPVGGQRHLAGDIRCRRG
ncbi:hypothetical protein [Mycobacterium sp. DL592]|uniref:hypothetical protein n=1 Tax=Mycobacterium sp. DL592 TaxID=2675524 RepID=UPI00352DAE15